MINPREQPSVFRRHCHCVDHQLGPVVASNNADDLKQRTAASVIPPLGDFQKEWINACKGSLKTSCDFDYGSKLIEQMLLGLVAYRVGKKIAYDGAAGRVTDNSEANDLLRRTYRAGWTLNG